jgi:hypothetical protein
MSTDVTLEVVPGGHDAPTKDSAGIAARLLAKFAAV